MNIINTRLIQGAYKARNNLKYYDTPPQVEKTPTDWVNLESVMNSVTYLEDLTHLPRDL